MTQKKRTSYPSGRKGGSENVWNFGQPSYEPSAIVPSMRNKLKKHIGKNIHK